MYKIVSLFSGAGGLDLGFKKAGFNNILSVEYWNVACSTLKENNMSKKIICDDIRNIDFKKELGNEINSIDVLIGGPPCPPYSQTRHYLENKKKGFDDKDFGFAVPEFFRALEEIRPKVFLFENVDGFSFKTHKRELDFAIERAESLGYQINYKVVNCANYGVPQTRKRFFMVGTKHGMGKFVFPIETHSENGCDETKKWVTAGEAIGDFDNINEDELNQKPGGKHWELLREVPPGDNYLYFTEKRGYEKPIFKWKSRYWTFLLKLSPNRPSWTIQASFSTNQGPFHWRNRFLRIEEIKRLQTFPDDYKLEGDFKEQWRQVGNAVPVEMAFILADKIKSILNRL